MLRDVILSAIRAMANDTGDLKQRFAEQLAQSLKKAYGGRMPSLSTIARDVSLRYPHLPHVSTEAVRQWLRGKAIPQSPRMQALANWLGKDLLLVLEDANSPVYIGNQSNNRSATESTAHSFMAGNSVHQSSSLSNGRNNSPNHASPGDRTALSAAIIDLLIYLEASDLEIVHLLAQSLAIKSRLSERQPDRHFDNPKPMPSAPVSLKPSRSRLKS